MRKPIRSAIGSLLVLGLVATNTSQASSLPIKKPVMTFLYDYRGACDDQTFTQEEYNAGMECQIFIRTYPAKPKRTMKLQWWNNDELGWVNETSKKTNKKGMVTLTIDPMCNGGVFCDGTFEYQIYSPKSGKYAAMWSDYTFDIEFLPLGSGY
jgi:hypothetical protein